MRILFTIPHFYRSKGGGTSSIGGEPLHGSEGTVEQARRQALLMSVASLHQTFGRDQAHIVDVRLACNELIAANIEVVVCTTGEEHLLTHLPSGLFKQHKTLAEPRLLGYECHNVMADSLGRFDYYCFLEDDILINDPLFFWKQRWFNSAAGDRAVLQPHRFELSPLPPIQKLYIDGPIRDPTISPKFQDKTVRPRIGGRMLGVEVGFERVDNPHSGCFFLTDTQMAHWSRQSYFLDRSTSFWGPLESAATLGLMRTFEVYKPALRNAGLLEVRHLDNRYLGRLVRLPDQFRLRAAD